MSAEISADVPEPKNVDLNPFISSFRGGHVVSVTPLRFGALKEVERARAIDEMEMTSVMVFHVLKEQFSDVTMDEVDNLFQPEVLLLIEATTAAGDSTDFIAPPSIGK